MTQDQATGINPHGEASQWSPNTNGLDGEGYAALKICSMLATLAGRGASATMQPCLVYARNIPRK